MKTLTIKWKQILAGLVFLGAIGVAIPFAVQWVKAASQEADQYPDAPFRPVGKDFPRIIRVRSMPTPEQSRAVYQLNANGAMSKGSPSEREALKLSNFGKFIQSRELAEKILENDPDSVPALYVLARAQFFGEANLPRALFCIRQARKVLEKRGQANPDDADSREWYLRALQLEYDILKDLDQAENQLRVVEVIEQIYEPLPHMKFWPLLKLKRFDDAEEALKQMDKTGHWQLEVLNDRLCLAEQRGQRLAVYQAGLAMTKQIEWSPCLWNNLGSSAQNAFLLEEAEKAYLKASSLGSPDFDDTPYRPLALLYIQQGRFPEALDCLKKARVDRSERRRSTLQQDQSKADRTVGLFLLALGKVDSAERFTGRAVLSPDRTGHTTEDETDLALTNGLVHWTVLSAKLEQWDEYEAGKTALQRLSSKRQREALKFEIWTLRQKLLKILQDPKRIKVLRPYMPGQSEMEAWLLGGAVQLLPTGIAEEALREMREQEDHPKAAAYFDSLEAEVALAQGRLDDALRLAKQALDNLPVKGEKLLRARAAVVAGEAVRRLGRTAESKDFSDQVLKDFPVAFRLLHVAIPVRIEDDGSARAQLVAGALRKSPRFRHDPNGFVLSVRTDRDKLTIELLRQGQVSHTNVTVEIGDDEEEMVANAVSTFHERLMSPTLDLSQAGVNSLEGSLGALRLQHDIDGILGSPGR